MRGRTSYYRTDGRRTTKRVPSLPSDNYETRQTLHILRGSSFWGRNHHNLIPAKNSYPQKPAALSGRHSLLTSGEPVTAAALCPTYPEPVLNPEQSRRGRMGECIATVHFCTH